MRIAIIGAGVAGMAAANRLIKKGCKIDIYEKAKFPGGAVAGIKRKAWDWYVDIAYHHLFTNDCEIINFANNIGFRDFLTRRPITASLYPRAFNKKNNTNSLYSQFFPYSAQEYKLDSPLDLLTFNRLNLYSRIRTGLVLAWLKFGPKLELYHSITAKKFLQKTMGDASYKTLWHPLFKKKFNNYENSINAMFFWARIKKRTPALSYPKGGFQCLAYKAADCLKKRGVNIRLNTTVSTLEKNKDLFVINGKNKYDAVISTLPSPLLLKIERKLLPSAYRKQLSRIKYLGAQTVLYETTTPLLKHTYWLNIADMKNPWMVALQHTNFIDKKYFNNNYIFYLATYTNTKIGKKQWEKKSEQIIWQKSFFIPYAQPLYTSDYKKIMPGPTTPVRGLYIANMERTYPFDRGTNYAVVVGRQAANAVIKKKNYK